MRHQMLIPYIALLAGCATNGSVTRDNQGHIVSIDISRGRYVPGTGRVVGEPELRPTCTTSAVEKHGNLTRLVSLNLSGQAVDSRVLSKVSAIHLAKLNLSATNFSNADLKVLARFPELEVLDLSGTAVTDDGLVHLLELRKLTILSVDDNSITEDGLKHLLRLPKIKVINMRNSKMQDEDTAIAEAQRLNVRINIASELAEVI